MPIFTDSDKAVFFPDIELSGDALNAAIAAAMGIAEGPQGAQRPLEKSAITETVVINGNVAYLNYLPIDLASGITLELRAAGAFDNFNREVGLSDWQPVDAERYELDLSTGEVRLEILGRNLRGVPLSHRGYANYGHAAYGVVSDASPLDRIERAEVRATYTSGFDFGDPVSGEALAVKGAIAEILKLSQTVAGGQKKFTLTDHYSVEVDTTQQKQMLDMYLGVLRQYRPRWRL